jgi:hypothetical protein
MKRHQELLTAAIEHDGEAQRALLAGDHDAAQTAFSSASELYRRSWEAAPPGSYGRLVGMLKGAILAGSAEQTRAAGYVRTALGDDPKSEDSPTAAYALALSAIIEDDDAAAHRWSGVMRRGSEPFERTAAAIEALAERDRERYAAAVRDIVRDFEQRSAHLTGVAIADTALALERLAAPRGLAAGLRSELLPAS